jgi:hypothetical protein
MTAHHRASTQRIDRLRWAFLFGFLFVIFRAFQKTGI